MEVWIFRDCLLQVFLNSSFKVRYFKDKGYAFVRYDNKESACNAIVALHLTEVEIEKSFMNCVWNFVLPGGGAGCEVQLGQGGGRKPTFP